MRSRFVLLARLSATDVVSHIVVTKNGADSHIYINGIDVTVAGANVTFASQNTAITCQLIDKSLDEVAVYNTSLSADRVLTTHYRTATAPTVPSLTLTPTVEYV